MGPARRGTLLSFFVGGGGFVCERVSPEKRSFLLFSSPMVDRPFEMKLKLSLSLSSSVLFLSFSPFYALHRPDIVGIVVRHVQRRGQLARL